MGISQNIVHRDIAASRNDLLASPFMIYLADFGFSGLKKSCRGNSTQTARGDIFNKNQPSFRRIPFFDNPADRLSMNEIEEHKKKNIFYSSMRKKK